MAKLFDRTQIGSMKLRNRIFVCPMGTGTDPDGGFSEQTRMYYEERAAGGFGLIITGTAVCNDKYEAKAANRFTNFQMIERLQRVAESVHAQGAKLCLQLGAGSGRMALPEVDRPPHAPSAIPCSFVPSMNCIPFTIDEIKELEESYGTAAKWAKTAGVDAIQIHGYGGYLTDQFMTELWNHRTDEYGGSFENRMRFPLNLIKQVQKNCGEDFPILFKMTLTHHCEGGRTIEEGLEIAKCLEKAGVAELHIEHGSFENWYYSIPTVYDEFGPKVELAAMVKKIVNIPVSCDGKLNDPKIAIEAIESGKVDYVGLGKQAIADPFWPKKVKEGRYEDIRYCIGCSECLQGVVEGKLVSCQVNPRVGFENFSDVHPAKTPKKVLIIGGGPAGMQAALTAAERGHHVTIWEKANRLGGWVNAAGEPSFKRSVKDYKNYLIAQVRKPENHITIVQNREATIEMIEEFGADWIILATGAVSTMPPIPGLNDNPKVGRATEHLMGNFDVNGKVVIIGGGLVGCETAIHVAINGCQVDLIETLGKIVPLENLCSNNEQRLARWLTDEKVTQHFNAKVQSVTETEVIFMENGEEKHIPYDYILVATGQKSNNQLANMLYQKFDDKVFVIGSADKPGTIGKAVHDAFHVAKNQL